MGLRGPGKPLDCLGLSILLENKGLGKVNEQITGEDDEKGLADRPPDADLKNNRHEVGNEQEKIGEVKNPEPGTALFLILDLPVPSREPFGKDENEEVDRQGEVINRAQHLEVIFNDRDRLVQVKGCERYLHQCFWLRK